MSLLSRNNMRNTLTFLFLACLTMEVLAQKVTFYEDVQPIIHAKCSGCHRPGGGGPFNLITYDDVSKRSDFIKKVITSRYMPPWRANDHYVDFANNRSLSEEQIALITKWIDNGTPKGKTNLKAEKELLKKIDAGTTYGRAPDLTLKMNYAYRLKGDGKEHFMVFKIPFERDQMHNVEAVEFTTSDKKVIHHANFAIH
ncbi:MAG TPA: cytochrome c, partial [Chryseosolibacter sp.]|nr:cytochrome c [Chryseosolibacter sp.]